MTADEIKANTLLLKSETFQGRINAIRRLVLEGKISMEQMEREVKIEISNMSAMIEEKDPDFWVENASPKNTKKIKTVFFVVSRKRFAPFVRTEGMSIEKRMMYMVLVPASKGRVRYSYEKHHKVFDAKVKELCGGVTIYKPVKGEWMAPDGTLFTDRMIPVMIAVRNKEDIKEIARFALEHYSEEAILYYKVSDEVEILHRDA